MYCAEHNILSRDDTACWLCVSREVDPPDLGHGSWWWRIHGYPFCMCKHLWPHEGWCLRCGLPLWRILALDTSEGSSLREGASSLHETQQVVLDSEQQKEYTSGKVL